MIFGVITFIFFLTRMLPGDPVLMRMPRSFTQEMYDNMKARLGLDKPVYIQYLIYIRDVLSGHWGYSMSIVRDSLVWDVIFQRLPRTLEIMIISMPIAIFFGIKLGKVSGANRNKKKDYAIRSALYITSSVPGFLIGIFLIATVLHSRLWILPYSGYKHIRMGQPPPVTHSRIIDSILAGDWLMLTDYLWHLFLPILSLVIFQMVIIARQTRASMIGVLEMEYIRTAEAKGCSRYNVLSKHALKNTFPTTLTVAGFGFPRIFAGSVAIEVAFNLQGLGQLFYYAVNQLDYTVMIAIVYMCAIIVIIFNLLIDVLYGVVDPRIKYR